jgi:hypothetical protein
MVWTTPRDWTAGELVTEAIMDTHVRDNLLATGPHLIARKTANESVTSSTALQDDDHLFFTIAANEVWLLEYRILGVTPAAADYSLAFSVPTGCTTYRGASTWTQGGTLINYSQTDTTGGADRLPVSYDGIDADGDYIIIPVAAVNGGTGGTFMLRWAQQTSNATPTTFRTNSTLWGVKLA